MVVPLPQIVYEELDLGAKDCFWPRPENTKCWGMGQRFREVESLGVRGGFELFIHKTTN